MGMCLSVQRDITGYSVDAAGNVTFTHTLRPAPKPGEDVTKRINRNEEDSMKRLRKELRAEGIRTEIRRVPHIGKNFIGNDGAQYTQHRFTLPANY